MKLTPQDTSPPVALLEHVGQQFGATIALRDISLAIPARRMVGLIGPDGVGKSSMLSLIAGARAIEQGNVMVLGGDSPTACTRCRGGRSRQSSAPE